MKTFYLYLLLLLMISGTLEAYSQEQTPADKFEQVSARSIHSKTLGEERQLFIYLPDEYSENKNFPVLYLLDGERIDRFTEALQTIKTNPEVGPHIIVGIKTVENRNRDMIPVSIKTRPGSGGAAKFLKFFVSELIPYIDQNFNTNGNRILYGASNAGLFTIYAMLEKPESFFAFISSSSMIGHCPDFMYQKLKKLDTPNQFKGKYLYVHYGMKDRFKQVTEFLPEYYENLSTSLNGKLITASKSLPDAGHVPDGGLNEGLIFIYSN